MKANKYLLYRVISFTAFVWLGLDILTKKWAASSNFRELSVIDNFFYLTPFQTNDGIAFGIDMPTMFQITAGIAILFLLVKVGSNFVVELKKARILAAVFLGAVIGGGVGNLIDRIAQGSVIDFIVLGPIPVFNIADVGITVGLAALFATMLLETKTK